jgi:hypothetical protein
MEPEEPDFSTPLPSIYPDIITTPTIHATLIRLEPGRIGTIQVHKKSPPPSPQSLIGVFVVADHHEGVSSQIIGIGKIHNLIWFVCRPCGFKTTLRRNFIEHIRVFHDYTDPLPSLTPP